MEGSEDAYVGYMTIKVNKRPFCLHLMAFQTNLKYWRIVKLLLFLTEHITESHVALMGMSYLVSNEDKMIVVYQLSSPGFLSASLCVCKNHKCVEQQTLLMMLMGSW